MSEPMKVNCMNSFFMDGLLSWWNIHGMHLLAMNEWVFMGLSPKHPWIIQKSLKYLHGYDFMMVSSHENSLVYGPLKFSWLFHYIWSTNIIFSWVHSWVFHNYHWGAGYVIRQYDVPFDPQWTQNDSNSHGFSIFLSTDSVLCINLSWLVQ